MSLLSIALSSSESTNVDLVSYCVGGGSLLLLLIALFAVLSFGKGQGNY